MMMCQFHSGTLDQSYSWLSLGPQGISCRVGCASTFHGLRSPGCHEPPTAPRCHDNAAVCCCYGNDLLQHLAAGTWPLWTQGPAQPPCPVGLTGYYSNGTSSGTGCRSAKRNRTSFKISDILQIGGSPATEQKKTSTKSIVRPWDTEVSSRDRSKCSKEWQSSDDEEEMEERRIDEEEIDVGNDVKTVSKDSKKSSECPLNALFKMTNRTQFESPDLTIDYVTDDSGTGSNQLPLPVKDNLFHRSSHPAKKRRKTRTAFTNQQIFQLEKRFLYQKYLTPTDRDELALTLRLSNSQVITWFQNRRAKLKRDLEELKADVTAAKALGNEPPTSVLSRLDELMKANDSALKRKDKSDTCRQTANNSTVNFKADENAVSTTVTTEI